MTNNWHRLIWTLNADAATVGLFQANKPNRFWLVPHVHSGPDVTVGDSTYASGSLCYRVEFDDSDMKSVWKNLSLFAAGKEPAKEPSKKNRPPGANRNTFRLEAKLREGGETTIVTLVLHPSNPDRLYVNRTPNGMYGPSGEDGWAKADQ